MLRSVHLEPYNVLERREWWAMGAAMMGTMYFLWTRCAQYGGGASGGGLAGVYEVTGLLSPCRNSLRRRTQSASKH